VNVNWLVGVTSTFRMNKSTTYNFNSAGGSTRSESSSLSISASYATKGGFKIPIPIWPFKGATFKNEINFSLAYDMSTNTTYQKQFNQADFQETQTNDSWKLRPSATYRFNTRVSGSLFYETGVTENKISGKFSWNEFGITVNIAIRD
jgi:cell surface protein SprA